MAAKFKGRAKKNSKLIANKVPGDNTNELKYRQLASHCASVSSMLLCGASSALNGISTLNVAKVYTLILQDRTGKSGMPKVSKTAASCII